MQNDLVIYMSLFMVTAIIILLLVSFLIPFYYFQRKWWKGLFIGIPVQIAVFILGGVVIGFGSMLYVDNFFEKEVDNAMVTVRGTDVARHNSDTLVWSLTPDEVCLVGKEKEEVRKRFYCDFLRLSPVSVGVEDRIVVTFDVKHKKVTATDMDKPMEVVQVDWEKVNDYLNK